MHVSASVRSCFLASLLLFCTAGVATPAAWIRPAEPVPLSGELFEAWRRMAFLPVSSIPQLTGPETEAKHAADQARRLGQLAETPHLRRTFSVDRPVASATLTLAAIGYAEASLNGQKVGDHEMAPAVRQYRHLVNEVEHDVTAMLRQGLNDLGLIVADGWFRETLAWDLPRDPRLPGGPLARAELRIVFADGTERRVPTDASWASTKGPVRINTQYGGEVHDLTRLARWERSAGLESDIQRVEEIDIPFIEVVTQEIPPQREIRRVEPVAVSEPRPGVYVFDLGETVTGFPELRLPAGQTGVVHLRGSEYVWNENLQADWHHAMHYAGETEPPVPSPGMLVCKRRSSSFMATVRDTGHRGPIGMMTWTVKPSGDGEPFTFRPKFAITVMRHVEVVGLDAPPSLADLDAVVIHNDLPRTDVFETSDPVINGIYEAAARSTLINTQSMSWDNATERNQTTWPWTWAAPFITGLGDWSGVYAKFLTDQEAWVLPSGKTSGQTLSDRAVGYRSITTPLHETPAVDLAWVVLQRYGDVERVRSYYPVIPRFIDHYWAGERGERYLAGIRGWDAAGFGLPWKQDPDAPSTNSGDHVETPASALLPFEPLSAKLFVTACHWVDVMDKASAIAGFLGESADRDRFSSLAATVRGAVRESGWRDPETGAFGAVREKATGAITTAAGNPISNAMAVAFGIVDADEAARLAAITWDDLQRRHGGHLVGGREWKHALYLLSEHGRLDEATAWMKSTEFPAIGHFTETLGLGTIPEVRLPAHGGALRASSAQSESQHFANWFVEVLAGFRADESEPGMRRFVLDPGFTRELSFVRYETLTPHGRVRSAWERDGDRVAWSFIVPAGGEARVRVPAGATIAGPADAGDAAADGLTPFEGGDWRLDFKDPSGKH